MDKFAAYPVETRLMSPEEGNAPLWPLPLMQERLKMSSKNFVKRLLTY